jgi:hypothetical protein
MGPTESLKITVVPARPSLIACQVAPLRGLLSGGAF